MSDAADKNWDKPLAVPPPTLPPAQFTPQPDLLVSIAHGSVVISNTAYPLHNITSVNLSRLRGDTSLSTALYWTASLIGLLLLILLVPLIILEKSFKALLLLIVLMLVPASILLLASKLRKRVKDWFVVTITTNAGQQVSFRTKDLDSAEFTAAEIVRQSQR